MKTILSLLVLLSFSSFAQNSTIKGLVVENDSKKPIPYATVALYKSTDSSLVNGTLTNNKGQFSFNNVTLGSYFLKIEFIGFDKRTTPSFDVKNASLELEPIVLGEDTKLLDEVVIKGEKSTVITKVDRQVYEAKAFQSSQGGTATDVIRNMPSVNVDGQGEITVRGTSGFVVLIDGKPIQTQAATILNQLPANSIENVEIITSPLAKFDSEGKGGIINIVTKKGTTDGLFFQVNGMYGLPSIEDYDNSENAKRYGADFTLGYKKGKWNLSFGASYTRKDKTGRREGDVFTNFDGVTNLFPSDGERSFDEENYSGRFSIGFTPNSANDFNLGFFAGKRTKTRTADILYNNSDVNATTGAQLSTLQYFNENDRTRKGDFVLGSFDYTHKFKNKSAISSSLLYEYTLLGGPTTNLNLEVLSNGVINRNKVLQNEFNTNDNPLHGIRYQLDYKLKPSDLGQFEVGYQFRNLDHDGDFDYFSDGNVVDAYTSTVNLKRNIHAAYGQFTGEKGKWNYGFGLRGEIMNRELELKNVDTGNETLNYDFAKLFPSVNLKYDLGNGYSSKLGYSKRVDRPSSFKLNPFKEREHSETFEQGDKNLRPEFIDAIELGITKKTEKITYFGTVYYRHVQNLINRVNDFAYDPGTTVIIDTILDRIYSNVGVGNSVGFELGSEVKPAKWIKVFTGVNVFNQQIKGSFRDRPINNNSWIYSINNNTTFTLNPTTSIQFTFNYISARNTAQGEDSRYYSPNLTVKKTFLDDRLVATVQWQNMDMGLLSTNEQRITTERTGDFFTTTNYVYEVDMVILNLSYTFNKKLKKTKFTESEFGKKEF
ncbi:MAG: TonB-dependent receptor [Cyclobacteriaceae bacterium]